MITKDEFKCMLLSKKLGFTALSGKDKGIYCKQISNKADQKEVLCELRVDFNRERLIYPEKEGLRIWERQTCNFSASENFVVFECVCRLLEKGYHPARIELEPKWKIGHGMSGGRADILVTDNRGKPYLIIECKRWERFEAAWKETLLFGGQLFSYAHQAQSTQFICLYASEFKDGTLLQKNHIISLRDNAEYLKSLQEPFSFADAKDDAESLYRAWFTTYDHEYETRGIFEEGVRVYGIGERTYTEKGLLDVTHEDIQKKYHQFATILRQHNVSGRENAFDKLVNLFLAKIVDEMENPDELQFYWRGVAFDDYFSLQDRILRLYRDGMQKFLNEEVTYIDDSIIQNAFCLFKNDPDETRDTITKYFRQLKFYTNNDFSFLDVHNEHLFKQNSAILLEIVKMIQDIRLKTKEQNQFLGDLFEGFLDQGVKQSEGQFFTPMPIVKFLVSSLPLQQMISSSPNPLAAIDYACGAGHFLTEYAAQLRAFVETDQLPSYYKQTCGIEKEYRLSKVAKVSAFMYGQEETRIIYGDALAQNKGVKNGMYHVLISNPPYSVKGFLETLSEKERKAFTITDVIDPKNMSANNSIEAFFVERAKQLLAPGGVAAIILPSSILSNSGAVYTKAREIILRYFDVIAVVEFGSGTFGKTSTNTVTLFLRRRTERPSIAEHYRNRVSAWFNGDFTKDCVFNDAHLLEAYCAHVGYDLSSYKTLLQGKPDQALMDLDVFQTYRIVFQESSEVKSLWKKQFFQKMSEADRQDELHKRLVEYICSLEQEKLYYFMLAYSNPQDVVVVKSPSGTQIKTFLGYEWSSAKGSEGIKYLQANQNGVPIPGRKGIDSISTPLFNPHNLNDTSKINSIIRANFTGASIGASEFVTRYRLVDMIDFSDVKFEKTISLSATKTLTFHSKYLLYELCQKAEINPSKSAIADIPDETAVSFVSMTSVSSHGYIERKEDRTLGELRHAGYTYFAENDIIIAKITPCFENGKCALACDLTNGIGMGSTEFHVIRSGPELLSSYLFFLLNQPAVREAGSSWMTGSSGHRRVPDSFFQQLRIPVPPISVQEQLVAACERADEEYRRTRQKIEAYRRDIEGLFDEAAIVSLGAHRNVTLRMLAAYSDQRVDCTGLTADSYVGVDNLLPDKGGKAPSDYVPQEGTVTGYAAGNILLSNIRPYLKKIWFADREGGCSGDVLALVVTSSDVLPRFLYYMLSSDQFFHYEMQYKKGVKMPRGDKQKILEYPVLLPPLAIQRRLLDRAEQLEQQISAAEQTLRKLETAHQEILAEYLN